MSVRRRERLLEQSQEYLAQKRLKTYFADFTAQILRTQPDEPLSFLFSYMQRAYPNECKASGIDGQKTNETHAHEIRILKHEHKENLASVQRRQEQETKRSCEEMVLERNRFVAAMKHAETEHANSIRNIQGDMKVLVARDRSSTERSKALQDQSRKQEQDLQATQEALAAYRTYTVASPSSSAPPSPPPSPEPPSPEEAELVRKIQELEHELEQIQELNSALQAKLDAAKCAELEGIRGESAAQLAELEEIRGRSAGQLEELENARGKFEHAVWEKEAVEQAAERAQLRCKELCNIRDNIDAALDDECEARANEQEAREAAEARCEELEQRVEELAKQVEELQGGAEESAAPLLQRPPSQQLAGVPDKVSRARLDAEQERTQMQGGQPAAVSGELSQAREANTKLSTQLRTIRDALARAEEKLVKAQLDQEGCAESKVVQGTGAAVVTREALTDFFEQQGVPEKVAAIDEILSGYAGNHNNLRRDLREKYGAEPREGEGALGGGEGGLRAKLVETERELTHARNANAKLSTELRSARAEVARAEEKLGGAEAKLVDAEARLNERETGGMGVQREVPAAERSGDSMHTDLKNSPFQRVCEFSRSGVNHHPSSNQHGRGNRPRPSTAVLLGIRAAAPDDEVSGRTQCSSWYRSIHYLSCSFTLLAWNPTTRRRRISCCCRGHSRKRIESDRRSSRESGGSSSSTEH
jgi:DNA repair exonuclease SbcCD ATPase subunit